MRTALRPALPAFHPGRRTVALTAAALAAAGVLALPGLAQAAPPSSTPTNVQVTGDAGTLTLSADSTAEQVAFRIDSAAQLIGPFSVAAGTVSQAWDSWGYANGSHAVTAYDCTVADGCASAGTSASFSLNNAAPTLTAPAAGPIAATGFALGADSAGGSVQYRIDGSPVALAAAPYAVTYTGAALPGGIHAITAVQCAFGDQTHCDGPESDPVSVTVAPHPSITSLAPSLFSPKVTGPAKLAYTLDAAESITVAVIDAHGTAVRTDDVGPQPAGANTWTWDGTTDDHTTRAADGAYTVTLTAAIAGAGSGTASRTVRLDTAAPSLSSVTGGGATFYPYPDGYKDTFTPSVMLGEGGVLKLIVKNSSGVTVRTIQASKAAGRRTLTWNGRNAANQLVAAGGYRWMFIASDAAGNTARTASHSVTVSSKRLVRKTKAITDNGSAYVSTLHYGGSCATISRSGSAFSPAGALLSATCRTHFAAFVAHYRYTIPSAIKYGNLSLQAYGYTHRGHVPSLLLGGILAPATGVDDATSNAVLVVNSTRKTWRNLGHIAAAGHYSRRHVVRVMLGVGNTPLAPADFDVRSVRLGVTYYVLQ